LLRLAPGIEVLAVGDQSSPALGTPDPEILRWIEKEGYILVSRNRRTMPLHLKEHLDTGSHIPGIFLIRRGASLAQVIQDLILIQEAGIPEDYLDRLEYLPL
jgi:hypothetical protein